LELRLEVNGIAAPMVFDSPRYIDETVT